MTIFNMCIKCEILRQLSSKNLFTSNSKKCPVMNVLIIIQKYTLKTMIERRSHCFLQLNFSKSLNNVPQDLMHSNSQLYVSYSFA